jgi:hypothetical protein
MRRELWLATLAVIGWALAGGLYLGTRVFNQGAAGPAADASLPVPVAESAPAATKLVGPAPLSQWLPEKGESIADPSGGGLDAQVHGTAHIITAWEGQRAFSFDGSGDNGFWSGQPQNCGISIDKPLRRAFETLSVEAWVRKERAGWMPVVTRDRWDDPQGFGLYMEWSEGKAAFGHYGNESGVQSNSVVQDGQWHHLVGTMGPNGDGRYRYRMYVDGHADAEQVGAWAVAAAPADGGRLMIAYPNNSGAEKPLKGDLGPVALFEVELTAEEVTARYENQKPH